MKITGIITEYNPFHNGHKLHLEKAKSMSNSQGIVCVMSGNFMQRGIPSLLNKWDRTKMALLNGVDLVIELPTVFSTSSAEFFAKGSVSILNSLGVVDSLCFGSECGDIEALKTLAKILQSEPENFKYFLKENLNKGLPFSKARANALLEYLETNHIPIQNVNQILSSSNNILAIEYIKWLIKLNSNIKPLTITRTGDSYLDKDIKTKFASATALRENLLKGVDLSTLQEFMTNETYSFLDEYTASGNSYTNPNNMFKYIKYALTSNKEIINSIPDANEGLHQKILNELHNSNSLDELIMNAKSKRYTYTRINRILCNIFLNCYRFNINSLRNSNPSYARILGLNKTGATILKEAKKNSSIKLITKLTKDSLDPMLEYDIHATNLYSLISDSTSFNSDFLKSPIILK